MFAVAYLRVSTEKQETEAQKKAIEEFAQQKGFRIIWFEEPEGVSGAVRALERPVFKQLWEFLKSNPDIKDLVVFELSRLGRDYDDLKYLLNELSRRGIRLWIVTLPTWNELIEMTGNSENPLVRLLYKLIADLIVNVMVFTTAQERELIRIRTKAGMARAKASGKHVGRPPYPWPEDEIRSLLKRGYRKKDIWRILRSEGKICRSIREKEGKIECMSYDTFIKKLKKSKI